MKIGLLTLPLNSNYGGILQALALQTALRSLGHDVILLNRESRIYSSRFPYGLLHDLKFYLKQLLNKPNYYPSISQKNRLTKKLQNFILKHFNQSESLCSDKLFQKYLIKENFDAIIVGSDQVWRPCYTDNIFNYFLEIGDIGVKKIAYAASFGVDNWEYDESQTAKCRDLIKEFTAVSVRESSGKELCKEYLGLDAEIVLDPTLLFPKEFYMNLTKACPNSENELFCYILDNSEIKQNIIKSVQTQLRISTVNQFPMIQFTPQDIKKEVKDFSLPSVEQWIESFAQATCIVTDSFHGMVFSIIFNKPFWVIVNEKRGSTRFTSLLDQLNLTDRIIMDLNETDNIDFNKPINWDRINDILDKLRVKSSLFLSDNI